MAEHNFKITSYSIHLGERASVEATLKGGKAASLVVTSVLTCRGDDGQRISVYFYKPKDGETYASSSHISKTEKPHAFIYEDQANYGFYVDLLRNESPIWGYIETGRDEAEVRLYTGRWEPVGVGDEDFHVDPTR